MQTDFTVLCIILMVWCFTSVSPLLKSYGDHDKIIAQSCAEYSCVSEQRKYPIDYTRMRSHAPLPFKYYSKKAADDVFMHFFRLDISCESSAKCHVLFFLKNNKNRMWSAAILLSALRVKGIFSISRRNWNFMLQNLNSHWNYTLCKYL